MRSTAGLALLVSALLACTTPSANTPIQGEQDATRNIAEIIPVTTQTPQATDTPTPEPAKTSASDPNKEAIADFSDAALRIEDARNKAVEHWMGSLTANKSDLYAYGGEGFAGLADLIADLALLDAAQQMQTIKDALLTIYQLELSAAEGERTCVFFSSSRVFEQPVCEFRTYMILRVNKDNVETTPLLRRQKVNPWLAAQRLRASTYERWLDILETHGIGTGRYPFDILR